MSQRRAYVDNVANELIFLVEYGDSDPGWVPEHGVRGDSWVPDMQAMDDYRRGHIRIFNPFDDLFITMGRHSERQSWPLILPEETAAIRALLVHPWIPLNAVYSGEDVPLDRIQEFQEEHARSNYWGNVLRPQLAYPDDHAFRLSILAQPYQPPAQTQTQTHTQTISPMPSHVARILLEHAEHDGVTCAITGEAITTATASVTSCGHIFETTAIRTWLSTHTSCPECRQPCAIGR